MKRLGIFIGLLLIFSSYTFGDIAIETISPNTWITAEAPSEVTDPDEFNDNFSNLLYYDFAPYYKVYRLPVSISDYTIYMKHPGGEYKNILVSGTNPLPGNTRTFNSYEVQAMESFFLFFQQPYLELPEKNTHATRVSFSIHPKSDSRNIYFIAYFNKPGDDFEFMVKSPADPANDVENNTENPYAPYLKGHYWGIVHELPVYLSKDNYVDDNQSSNVTSQPDQSNLDNKDYSDTPAKWADQWIKEAISLGLIPDNMRNSYDKALTRQDFVDVYVPLLEKLRGLNYPQSNMLLKDTSSMNAKIAVENRIIAKFSGDLFIPDAALTREKASFYLYAGIKTLYPYEKSLTNVYFADVQTVEPVYLDSLFYWVEKGVYSKFSDGRVDPKRVMTRQEFYVSVLRIFKAFR
jgi:hypothetical protein